MKRVIIAPTLLVCYLLLIVPFTGYMRSKPVVEKLGYVPQAEVLKFISADQKPLVAVSLVMKTLFYFGSLVEINEAKIVLPPDYFTMYKTIETAVKLEPYNMDAYYFAQAVMVWDAKRVREANALLEYGMRFRDWDFNLPFFAAFNYAYFLKDYRNAAKHYQKAAELSGDPLYANLAGRYLYEAGRTDLAIAYVAAMEKSARNEAIKKTFRTRLKALQEVRRIEAAFDGFRKDYGQTALTVEELVQKGYLSERPVDPYGGHFYIDGQGQVRSTSKFAFAGAKEAGR